MAGRSPTSSSESFGGEYGQEATVDPGLWMDILRTEPAAVFASVVTVDTAVNVGTPRAEKERIVRPEEDCSISRIPESIKEYDSMRLLIVLACLQNFC